MLFLPSYFDRKTIMTATLENLKNAHDMHHTMRRGRPDRRNSILNVGNIFRSKLGNSIYDSQQTLTHRGKPHKISLPSPIVGDNQKPDTVEFLTLDLGPDPSKSLDMDINFSHEPGTDELSSFNDSSLSDFSQTDSATEESATESISSSIKASCSSSSIYGFASLDPTSGLYNATGSGVYLHIAGPSCPTSSESTYLWQYAE